MATADPIASPSRAPAELPIAIASACAVTRFCANGPSPALRVAGAPLVRGCGSTAVCLWSQVDRGEAAIPDVEFTRRLRAFLSEISDPLIVCDYRGDRFFWDVALTGFLLPRFTAAVRFSRSAGRSRTPPSSPSGLSGGLLCTERREGTMR
jgi:hypothetical protein